MHFKIPVWGDNFGEIGIVCLPSQLEGNFIMKFGRIHTPSDIYYLYPSNYSLSGCQVSNHAPSPSTYPSDN